MHDHLLKADVAIVFGITKWMRPAERAVQLYREGCVKRLVFTGGFNARADGREGPMMAEEAIRNGVPAEAILIEEHATNTAENLVFSMRALEQAGVVARSVLLVAIHFHTRRVLMTAERALPAGTAIGTVSYPSAFYTADNWRASDKGRADVAQEVGKIRQYLDPLWAR